MTDDLAQQVGERIKQLRKQAGVGVREQARALGVSASSLSALENGNAGVSLSRLQVVAKHFGVHITDLLAASPVEADDQPEVEVVRHADPAAGSVARRGKGTNYRLIGSGHNHLIQPATITFEPGGGYEMDQIAHEGEEFVYVIYGDIELVIGDDVHRLGPGDSARFRSTAPHAFRNGSQTDVAVAVAAATPPW